MIAAHGNLGERAGERRRHGDAGGRTVLRDRAFRHVHVDVDVAIEVARQPELLRAAADVGERGLRRLLHDVAKLPGERQLALAVEHLHFGGENAAAHLGPGQAGDQADFVLLVRLRIAELRHAEKFARCSPW